MKNLRNKWSPLTVLFALAFLLVMRAGYAGATPVGTYTSELNPTAPGQTFYGDGAVFSNGYLVAPVANPTGDKCLQCHANMESYLKTGHGNMLVKTRPVGQAWKGANQLPYPSDATGHPIDWSTGTVDLGGYCNQTGFEGQFDKEGCEARTGGVWTPGTRLADIIYTIGGWMSVDAPDIGILLRAGDPLPTKTFYMGDGRTYGTCGSCHTAGYKASDYTRPQPYADYSADLNTGSAAGVGGSWVLDGIQCERCHDASNHPADPHANPATEPIGADSTKVCSQCHIRAGAWEYAVNPPASPPAQGPVNPNWATQATAYPLGASATAFSGHSTGKQFLNSPHAKFSGAYNQISDNSLYDTHFSEGTCSVGTEGQYLTRSLCQAAGGTWTSNNLRGCATCHDVHESTVLEAKENFGAEPIRRQCGIACHTSSANLATMNHPTGTYTPFTQAVPTTEQKAEACVVCHMPGAAHVFRINTDAEYSTFPTTSTTEGYCSKRQYTTKADCTQNSGTWTWKVSPGICSNPSFSTNQKDCTDPDTGGYCYDTGSNRLPGITTKAACTSPNKWQAYSWSAVANSAAEGEFADAVWVDIDHACGQCHGTDGKAHLLNTKILGAYAVGMHAGTGTPFTCTDCHTSTAAAHPTGANTPTDCSGCHGTTRAGERPTIENACLTCHGSNGGALHQFTAAQIATYADAIHAGGAAPSTTCTDCHTETPEDLINHPVTTCTNCHSTPGVVTSEMKASVVKVAGVKVSGVVAAAVQTCRSCHSNWAPSFLATFAAKMHKNEGPVASMTLVPGDSQIPVETSVRLTDTSTDRNKNLSYITVNWGDGSKENIRPGDTVSHTYYKSGNKSISITAVDLKGLKSKTIKKITVLKPIVGRVKRN